MSNIVDIIIIGGGDVLNDYFLDKVASKFTGAKNKILAVVFRAYKYKMKCRFYVILFQLWTANSFKTTFFRLFGLFKYQNI